MECLLADPGQTVDPLGEIDRLDHDQDAHLRWDLDHVRLRRDAPQRLGEPPHPGNRVEVGISRRWGRSRGLFPLRDYAWNGSGHRVARAN